MTKTKIKKKDKFKVIILDDNELSLLCYAEEYPKIWKEIENDKNKGELTTFL